MPNLSLYIQLISLLLTALLAGKLISTGLWCRYPVFFWFIVFRIPQTIWPLVLTDTGSNLYEKVWMLTEPIFYLMHVLVVAELYRLVLENHRGIYTLGKWAMYASVVIAMGISVLTLIPHFKPQTSQQSKLLGYYFAMNRGVDLSLALFLLLILFFLSKYPVRLSRNVLVHAGLYTIYFFSDSLGVFLRTFFGPVKSQTIFLSVDVTNCACLLAWFLLLSRKGEEAQTAFPTFAPDRERLVLQQLDALNATLLKVGRK